MAQSGNGVDIGAVYRLLTEVGAAVREHSARLDRIEARFDGIGGRLDEHIGKLNEVVAIANEHSRKLDEAAVVLNGQDRKLDDLSHRLTDLYDAVGHYHHSVVGHGIAVNQLEERVKFLEEHLGLAATR